MGWIHSYWRKFFKDGRLGLHKIPFLGKYILSPLTIGYTMPQSDLHGYQLLQSLEYLGSNLGTYQPIQEDIKIEYGITRKINSGNFLDVYLASSGL